MRDRYMEKAKMDLINFIDCDNYSPEAKLERIDELVRAYKFQLEREIREENK